MKRKTSENCFHKMWKTERILLALNNYTFHKCIKADQKEKEIVSFEGVLFNVFILVFDIFIEIK